MEKKVNNFDMDKLLSKNNVWLKDHGTYRGQSNNDAKNLLRESKQNLRPAEFYTYLASAPGGNNNNNDDNITKPSLLSKRPDSGENNADSAGSSAGRQWGEPYKRRFPKERVLDVWDDFR